MKKILLAGVMGLALTGVAHGADWFQDMADRVVQQNNPKRLAAIARCIEADKLRHRFDRIEGDNMSVANQLHQPKPRNELADIQLNWCYEAAKRNNPNPGE